MSKFAPLCNKHAGYRTHILPRHILVSTFLLAFALPAQAAFEQAVTLSANSTLKPGQIKTENFIVQETVKNDGLFNHYTVKSNSGTFKASSTNALIILLNEINAIADMKQIDTDDAAMDALKQSSANTVEGIKQLINDPEKTVAGAMAGVSGLFHRAKETVGHRKSSDAEDNSLKQLIGISKSKGKIASQYGVNVYSRNAVLQGELDRLGQADFLGGLGVGVATSFVPGVGGLVLSASGTARLLNEAINTTPASELWLQNKNKLLAQGMNEDTVELFLNNPSFSPALSTVLVTALDSMKDVENLELFIKVALQSSDHSTASLITQIAVMTASYNKNISPLKTITPLARITQGVRKDGTLVVILPADHMLWSKRVAEAVAVDEALSDATELWLLGTLSDLATANYKALGWKVHTETRAELFPKKE